MTESGGDGTGKRYQCVNYSSNARCKRSQAQARPSPSHQNPHSQIQTPLRGRAVQPSRSDKSALVNTGCSWHSVGDAIRHLAEASRMIGDPQWLSDPAEVIPEEQNILDNLAAV